MFLKSVLVDRMDRTVDKYVMTNVQDVTTSMVPVTEDVSQAGREAIVNNVMYS